VKVLLTGGFGFLGGRIAEALRAASHDVVVSGRRTPDDAREWAKGFEVRHADLTASTNGSLDALTEGVDAVVHLAALNENDALKDPARASEVSADATSRLFESAKRSGARAFVFASTFHVYGAPPGAIIDEETPTHPTHPYAEAHLRGEARCRELHSSSCRAVVLRLSNAYGMPARLGVDRWTLAHNDFCRRAAEGQSIVLKSSGFQHRDFVWVNDVATSILLTLRDDDNNASPDAALFNVGGDHSISILDLAHIVRDRARVVLNITTPIEHPEPSPGERPIPIQFSIARLCALGFAPTDHLADETDRLLSALAAKHDHT
jgi:UDP-glucose 4-epimerase